MIETHTFSSNIDQDQYPRIGARSVPIDMSSRCTECLKKLSIVDMSIGKCKCGGVYCTKHRMSEAHSCSFDYRKEFHTSNQNKMVPILSSKVASI